MWVALSIHPNATKVGKILSLFAGCYSIACVGQNVRHESDMLGHEAGAPEPRKMTANMSVSLLMRRA